MRMRSRRASLGTAVAAAALAAGCGAPPERNDTPSDLSPPAAPSIDVVQEPATHPAVVSGEASADSSAARATLESYYAAIGRGDYPQAYRLWSDSGRASGQTAAEFAEGYAETTSVRVTVGDGAIQGAAGSRYAEFPVEIHATTSDGIDQRFAGRYVLRRSVVDGATAEQREWRIYSAEVDRIQ